MGKGGVLALERMVDLGGAELDGAGGQLRVLGPLAAGLDGAADLDDELRPHLAGDRVRVGRSAASTTTWVMP